MRAGLLREEVTVQRASVSRNDELGDDNYVWADLFTRRAMIGRSEGDEGVEDNANQTRRVYVIRMRHMATVTDRDRLRWGTKILNIQSIDEDRPRDRGMWTLVCVEQGTEQ